MKDTACYIGIDISKENFDAAFPQDGKGHEIQQYANNLSGWDTFESNLPEGAVCVVEATGPYHVKLATFLHGKGRSVCVVNPLQVKYFSRMKMSRAKTDRADACMIALYGESEHPRCWTPKAAHLVKLQQLLGVSAQLTAQKTSLENQRKSLALVPDFSEEAIEVLGKQVDYIKQQLASLKKLIDELVRSNYEDIETSLRSIPGIGPKTAAVLLLVTEGFTKFDHYKALVAYAGLAPRTYESGTSVKGPSHICKLGGAYLRKLLYECAQSAKRFNPICKKLFDRLYHEKKKPFRVAMIAVANKLIKLAFAIATSGQKFDPEYHLKFNIAK